MLKKVVIEPKALLKLDFYFVNDKQILHNSKLVEVTKRLIVTMLNVDLKSIFESH